VDQHLDIALGLKPVAESDQFCAEFLVVEDLSVADGHDRPVFIEQRLFATSYIDNAQTGCGACKLARMVPATFVRAAVDERFQHLL
jgi:hypothetical protein